MRATVEFTILETDREAALAVVRGALLGRGHRIDVRRDGSFTASRGNRLLTTVFGALVPADRRFRTYDLTVVPGAGSARLVLGHAEHGTAIAGGSGGAAARRTAWNLTVDGVEFALSVAGMLVHRADPIAEPA